MLLVNLILMFQTAALQHMGKLKNPVTNTIERDLHQAQFSIDLLDTIHTKMKGNLSPDEERMFSNVLQELRLNYVDEASKPETPVNAPVQTHSTEPTPQA